LDSAALGQVCTAVLLNRVIAILLVPFAFSLLAASFNASHAPTAASAVMILAVCLCVVNVTGAVQVLLPPHGGSFAIWAHMLLLLGYALWLSFCITSARTAAAATVQRR
jgi:Ca2+/Na+ antiporter